MKATALVLLACACTGNTRRGAEPEGETAGRVRTGVVRRGELADRVLISGAVQATSSEELRVPRTSTWELSIRWMAEDGAAVKAGERALEFDNSSFTSTLLEKRLALLDATVAFRNFESISALDLEQKDFVLQTAQIALAKAKVQASVPADLLPARTAQERQLELKRSESAVAKAENELVSARASNALEKKVKQIELDKVRNTIADAEKAISELVLTAPRDGILVLGEHPWMGRKYQVGDNLQPGWTVISLPDFGTGMEVRAELSDVDDGRVSIGMTGTCTLDAYPTDPLPCAVRDLMPVASGKGVQSLRRGFALVLSLEKFDRERMRPGMAVKVELKRQPLQGALIVPRGAVRFGDKDKVKVRLGNGDERAVELGPCDAQGCAVTRGLVDGDVVLIGLAEPAGGGS